MKKLFFVSAVLCAFCFASCKKEYTCTCSTTSGGVTISASTTIKDTKKKAKEACEAGSSSVGGVVTTCTIN